MREHHHFSSVVDHSESYQSQILDMALTSFRLDKR
jgi:hypothetical protein